MAEATAGYVISSSVIDGLSGFSKISFKFRVEPVSQQACGKKKIALREIIRSETEKFGMIIIGDVTIGITWYGNETRRYETDKDPDVDNIIKPILDSLVGANGVLIDDCQVQYVHCSWIDTNGNDMLEIDIKYMSDEDATKDGLFFVQYDGAVCMPLHYKPNVSIEGMGVLVDHVAQILLKAKALEEAGHPDAAHALKPCMRMFHRTRVGEFPVVMASAVRAYLEEVSKK